MSNEDEFYTEAADTFPRKEDFEDRLVAIWPTGKVGTRKSDSGDEYPFVETITMALDDGPSGTAGTGNASDDEPYLVGPAPAFADDIQWSAGGVYSRVHKRLGALDANGVKDYNPVVGRINRRKNQKKGFSDSWSLGKPTENDLTVIRGRKADIVKMTARVAKMFQEAEDSEAFTS